MSLAVTMLYFIGLTTDQLLPHQCLLCGRFCFDQGVCTACWDGAWPISAPLCHRCGRPLAHALPDHLCGQCWLAPADTFAPNMLQRRHHNKSQAELSRAQRKKNVAGIFSVPHKYRDMLSGRPVILVDDVMASGATLAAAARCLLAAGNGPVKGLLVAVFCSRLNNSMRG